VKLTPALQTAIEEAIRDEPTAPFYSLAERISLRARARDFLETKPGFTLSKGQQAMFEVFLKQLRPDDIPAHAVVMREAATPEVRD
jgi:hypothetical protein